MEVRSKKYTNAAKGQRCTLELAGVCNNDPSTVVFAHYPSPDKGMGIKSPDYWGCDACSSCHDELDRRTRYCEFDDNELAEYMLNALYVTMSRRFRAGIINVS